jgi:predicted MFS family arabinose efflux permease
VTLGASPAQIGILAAVNSAPVLVVGLGAGVWVDRQRRRPTLIAADLGRVVLLATIPVAALAGQLSIGQVYVIGFLTGVLAALYDVAYQAYLPSLVVPTRLVEANSKLAVGRSAANVVGLSLGGVVIQAITAPMAIALDALSYVVSALSIALIRRREEWTPSVRAPLLQQAREGLGVVFGNPLLRAMAGCLATSNLTSGMFFALYILFGTRELGLPPAALGAVYGVGTIGVLVGATFVGPIVARLGAGQTMILASCLGALEVVPAVFATPVSAVPLLVFASLIGNLGWSIYDVVASSLRQAIVPASLQGRMQATLSVVTNGGLPLAGLIGGALGEAIGVRETITLAAMGSLLSVLWLLFSPARKHERSFDVGADPSPSSG